METMRTVARTILTGFLFLGISQCLMAAAGVQGQVTDLTLDTAGNDVVLSWTTGTMPHRVLRSDTPTYLSGNRLVAQAIVNGRALDVDALDSGKTFFIQYSVAMNRLRSSSC